MIALTLALVVLAGATMCRPPVVTEWAHRESTTRALGPYRTLEVDSVVAGRPPKLVWGTAIVSGFLGLVACFPFWPAVLVAVDDRLSCDTATGIALLVVLPTEMWVASRCLVVAERLLDNATDAAARAGATARSSLLQHALVLVALASAHVVGERSADALRAFAAAYAVLGVAHAVALAYVARLLERTRIAPYPLPSMR